MHSPVTYLPTIPSSHMKITPFMPSPVTYLPITLPCVSSPYLLPCAVSVLCFPTVESSILSVNFIIILSSIQPSYVNCQQVATSTPVRLSNYHQSVTSIPADLPQYVPISSTLGHAPHRGIPWKIHEAVFPTGSVLNQL